MSKRKNESAASASSIESEGPAELVPMRAATVQVLRQFRQVFNAVRTHFQQIEKKAGLGGAQLWALSLIEAQPGIGVGQLARAMDLHPSTSSNLVKGLIEREYISTRRGNDRRAVELEILPAGRKVLSRAPGPFNGVLPKALEGLDERTLMRMSKDLAMLLAALDADERAAKLPLSDM